MQRLIAHHNIPHALFNENVDVVDDPRRLFSWCKANDIDPLAPLDGIEYVPGDEDTDDDVALESSLIAPKYSPISRAVYHYVRTNKIRFVVVDTISSMRERVAGLVNITERDQSDFLAFNTIGIATGCAIIGIHHMNKLATTTLAAVQAHSLGKISGTNAIAGAVQSIISMSRITDPSMDEETLQAIEPVGHKIIMDHVSRDGQGLAPSAWSMVKTMIEETDKDGERVRVPSLEWVHMGPADVLARSDEKLWICEWMFDQPGTDHKARDIFLAAQQAGMTNVKNVDSFRKMLQRMAARGMLVSTFGAMGGWQLSADERNIIKARRAAKKF